MGHALTSTSTLSSRDFRRQANRIRALVEDLAHNAPETARHQIMELRKSVRSMSNNVGHQVVDLSRKTAKAVQRHPVSAASAVVGTGLLAWLLLRRRS